MSAHDLLEPTIWLHIGTHKTGSSSLQVALYAHRHALADAGVLYPTEGVYCTPAGWDRPPPEGGHRYLAFAMMGAWPPWDPRDYTSPLAVCRAALRGDLSRWRERAPACRADVVLSSEYWYRDVEPEALRALVDGLGYRLRIVVYLRRQDWFLESFFDQRVRAAATVEPFERFVERHVDDPLSYAWYRHRLARLADVFGEQSLCVRPLERAQLCGGDVLSDLLACVGVGPALVGRTPTRLNPSLPTELSEAVRALVAQMPPSAPSDERLRLSHHLRLGQWPPGVDPVRYSRLTREARAALVERFADDNAQVARRFLGRADGRLFREPVATDRPLWPGLSPEALARAGLFAWRRCAAEQPADEATDAC